MFYFEFPFNISNVSVYKYTSFRVSDVALCASLQKMNQPDIYI